MYFDEYGRPDPQGAYLKIGDKLVLRDGRSQASNIMMMDSVQRSVHDALHTPPGTGHVITDQQLDDAYTAMCDHYTNAWRRPSIDPSPAEQPMVADADDAYAAMVDHYTTAWRRNAA